MTDTSMMSGRRNMVIGIFEDRGQAEDALNALQDFGYQPRDISIVTREERVMADKGGNAASDIAEGTVSGATTGGVIGGIAGLLIGVGAIVIPGVGGLLIGGPLVAALGLTGAAAATVSGAVTGAAAGGLLGALVGLGIPKERATIYEQTIREGGVLLAVPNREGKRTAITQILNEHGVSQVDAV